MRQWILVILCFVSTAASAEKKTTVNSLSLEQTIVRVLENNPLLSALDYKSKAAAARIRSARITTPYRASIGVENVGNSGADITETTLSLSTILERGDKAELRGDLKQNELLLLESEQDAQRLDLLAEATKRFLHIATNQERLNLARESLRLAKKTLKIVKARVRAGKAPQAELQRAKMNLSRRELELDHIVHELEVSKFKLVTMWGDKEVTFEQVSADLFHLKPLPSFNELLLLLENNPDLARFATEKRINRSQIELARSRQYADITVTGGVRYFSETEDTAFIVSVDIPLGSSSRAESYIEEAQMQNLSAEQMYQYQYINLEATLYELYQEAVHASEVVEALTEDIIPQAELALLEYEKGYKQGRYSFLELVEAQNVLIDARLDAVMAATQYHQLRIEIDRLTGAGLSTGVVQ